MCVLFLFIPEFSSISQKNVHAVLQVRIFGAKKKIGKTKPISGKVKSDSDTYLLNVHIESLPSKTTTKTDENGLFFFEFLE